MFVIPPTGKFLPVYEPNKHLICLAGGSGVTPFRAFVRSHAAQLETKITVLYSVRTTNDIIFDEEFRDLEQQNQNFNFYVTCTRLAPEDAWTGRAAGLMPIGSKNMFMTCPILSFTRAVPTNW